MIIRRYQKNQAKWIGVLNTNCAEKPMIMGWFKNPDWPEKEYCQFKIRNFLITIEKTEFEKLREFFDHGTVDTQ